MQSFRLLSAAFLLVASTTPLADTQTTLLELLQKGKEANRGVQLSVDGVQLTVLIREIRDGWVIGKNQQHDTVAVRLDQIDAVAF